MNIDNIDLDAEGIDGFNDDFNFDEPTAPDENRTPMQRARDGALGKLNLETTGIVARTVADNALPIGFKSAKDEVVSFYDEGLDLYDKSKEELSGAVRNLKKSVNKTVGRMSFLPDTVKNFVLNATDTTDDDPAFGDVAKNREEIQAATTASMISDIFDRQQEITNTVANSNAEASGELAKSQLQSTDLSNEYLANISSAASRDRAYRESIQDAYQRKMLELAQRHLFIARDTLSLMGATGADIVANLQSVVKNTGLPDQVKVRNSEEYMRITRDRLLSGLNDRISDFSQRFRGNLIDNVKTSISNKVGQFKEGLNSSAEIIDQMREQGEMMDEMGIDKVENLSGMATVGLFNKLGAKAGQKLSGVLNRNERVAKANQQILYGLENNPSLIQEALNKEYSNPVLNTLAQTLRSVAPRFDNQISIDRDYTSMVAEEEQKVSSRRSLIEVIPGLLSKILKQVTDIATGSDNQELVYSYKDETFQTREDARKGLADRIFNGANPQNSIERVMAIVNKLDSDNVLNAKERESLVRKIIDDANKGNTKLSLTNLSKGKLDFEGKEKLAESIYNRFGGHEVIDRKGNRKQKLNMGSADWAVERDLAEEIRKINGDFAGVREAVSALGQYGQLDIGRELGIIDRYNDSDVVDRDRLFELYMERAGDKFTSANYDDLSTWRGAAQTDHRYLTGQEEKETKKKSFFKNAQETIDLEKKLADERASIEKIRSSRRNANMGSDDTLESTVKARSIGTLGLTSAVSEIGQDILDAMRELSVSPTQFFEVFSRKLDSGDRAVPVYFPDGGMPGQNGPTNEPPKLHERLDQHLQDIKDLLQVNNDTIANMMYSDLGDDPELVDSIKAYARRMQRDSASTTRKIFGKVKGLGTTGMRALTSYYGFLGGTAKRAIPGIADVTGRITGGVFGKDGFAERIAGKFNKETVTDLYKNATDRMPLISKRALEAGDYIDAKTRKVITDLSKVKGDILDKDGNLIASLQELKAGLYDVNGEKIDFDQIVKSLKGRGKSALDTVTGFYGSMLSLPTAPLSMLSKAAKTAGSKVKDFLSRPMDIYVPGDSRPKLMASIWKAGGYFSSKTGEVITSLKDIDSDILDANGNVVLSLEEMRQGLFDRIGNKLSSSELITRVKGYIGGLAKLPLKLSTLSFKPITDGLRQGKDYLSEKSKGLGIPTVSGYGTLDKIYQFMVDKWGDGPVQSVPETIREENREMRALPKGQKLGDLREKVRVKKDSLMSGAKDAKKDLLERLTEIRESTAESDRLHLKVASLTERVMDAQDKMSKVLDRVTVATKEKKKKLFDSDGDGDRDGSWKDRIANKATKERSSLSDLIEKRRKEASDRLREKGKGGKDWISGLWSVGKSVLGGLLSKALGPVTLGLAALKSGLGGLLTKLITAVGVGKAAGIAGDVGDLAGDVDLGKDKSSRGRGKKKLLKSAAKTAVKGGSLLGGLARGAFMLGRGLVMANPITAGVAAAATVAYAGYKTYRYFSDRKDPSQSEKLRFTQYGIDVSDKSALSTIRNLEKGVYDELSWYGDKPNLSKSAIYFANEFAGLFGVDLEDQDAVLNWTTWFAKRFIPIYLTHLTSAREQLGTKDLDDVDDAVRKSSDFDFYRRVGSISLGDGVNNPSAITVSPFVDKPLIRDVQTKVKNIIGTHTPENGNVPSSTMSKDKDGYIPGDITRDNVVSMEEYRRRAGIPSPSMANVPSTDTAASGKMSVTAAPGVTGGQSFDLMSTEYLSKILDAAQANAQSSNYAIKQRQDMIDIMRAIYNKISDGEDTKTVSSGPQVNDELNPDFWKSGVDGAMGSPPRTVSAPTGPSTVKMPINLGRT